MAGSSSTIKIRVFMGRFLCGKFDRKNGAFRNVIGRADTAIMIRNDAVNDREAQAGPGFLFGKIWQEEILLVSRLDANTFIGDFDDDLSQFCLRSRGHPQTTLA